jgi:putative copper export protein
MIPIASVIVGWLLLGGQLVLAGSAAFACLVTPPAADAGGDFKRLTLAWAGWVAIGVVALSPVALLGQTAEMAGVSWRAALPLVPEVLRATHLGRVWLWRLPLAGALIVPAHALNRTRLKLMSLGAISAGLILLVALSSHAVDYGPITVGLYFVHMLAASLWIGALLGFWIGAGSGYFSLEQSAAIARRLSSLAGWCVAALIVTGTAVAYKALGASLDHLRYSAYGRTLINKLCFAAIAIAIGGYNRYRLIPAINEPASCKALINNVAIETIVLGGVLMWTVILARTPPAH